MSFEARDAWLGGGYSSVAFNAYLGSLESLATGLSRRSKAWRAPHVRWFLAYDLSTCATAVGDRSHEVYTRAPSVSSRAKTSTARRSSPSAVRRRCARIRSTQVWSIMGTIVNVEYRFAIDPSTTVSAFYDWARGYFDQNPPPGQLN